jgi:hypothetical protein
MDQKTNPIKLLIVSVIGTVIVVGGLVGLGRAVNGVYTGPAEVLEKEVRTGSCILKTHAWDGLQRDNSFGEASTCDFIEVGDTVYFNDSHPVHPKADDYQ